jgi:RNA polymerase sigma factor (sigma-70 family)
MTKRDKRRINREIAAIASLKDTRIDTSDIPEIFDWSGAIRGKFEVPNQASVSATKRTVTERQQVDVEKPTTKRAYTPSDVFQSSTVFYTDTGQLFEGVRQGNPQAEAEFVRRYRQLLLLRVRDRGLPPDTVEDIIQEVFLRLLSAIHSGQTLYAESLEAYVYSMARKVVLEAHKEQREKPEALSALRQKEQTRKEGIKIVEEVIKSLPPESRDIQWARVFEQCELVVKNPKFLQDQDIFWFYFKFGHTANEISNLTGIPVREIENTLARTIRLLTATLEK